MRHTSSCVSSPAVATCAPEGEVEGGSLATHEINSNASEGEATGGRGKLRMRRKGKTKKGVGKKVGCGHLYDNRRRWFQGNGARFPSISRLARSLGERQPHL